MKNPTELKIVIFKKIKEKSITLIHGTYWSDELSQEDLLYAISKGYSIELIKS